MVLLELIEIVTPWYSRNAIVQVIILSQLNTIRDCDWLKLLLQEKTCTVEIKVIEKKINKFFFFCNIHEMKKFQ